MGRQPGKRGQRTSNPGKIGRERTNFRGRRHYLLTSWLAHRPVHAGKRNFFLARKSETAEAIARKIPESKQNVRPHVVDTFVWCQNTSFMPV